VTDRERKNLQVIQGQKNKMTLKKSIILLCILLLVFFSGQRFIKIYQQKQIIDELKLQLEMKESEIPA
jgi:hypothetical protein